MAIQKLVAIQILPRMPLQEILRMTKKIKRHVEEIFLGKRRNMRMSNSSSIAFAEMPCNDF
jgi:hypothetical protein